MRWVLAPAVVGAVVFAAALLVEVSCAVGGCPTPRLRRLFDLDAVGGAPRLFTTTVFVAVAVCAGLAAVRSSDPRRRTWWTAVAAGGVLLVWAKAVSTHSELERAHGRSLTLVLGVLVCVVGLPLLWQVGRRWTVPGALAVTLALAGYALAALGLDQVTERVGQLTGSRTVRVVAVFVEEGGEAAAALLLLAVVARWLPARR